MFGYVKPYKPEMKLKEWETYKAVYCGLCKHLGKVFGQVYRLTLNYDFTFVALLYGAMQPQCPTAVSCRCVLHPLGKKKCMCAQNDLDYVSNAAIILFYYKIADNIQDEGFWKRLFYRSVSPIANRARKKAAFRFPEVERSFSVCSQKQRELENAQTPPTPDRCADPTATALSALFGDLCQEQTQKRVLERLGYLIGRFVYLSDALDDLEKDQKSNHFNPYLSLAQAQNLSLAQVRISATTSLNMTIGEAIATYELLELKRYKPILDNILYFGLQNTVQIINSQDAENCTDHRMELQ